MSTNPINNRSLYIKTALGVMTAAACSALALAIIFQPQQCIALGKQIKMAVLKERLKVQLPLALTGGVLILSFLIKGCWPKPKAHPLLTGEANL